MSRPLSVTTSGRYALKVGLSAALSLALLPACGALNGDDGVHFGGGRATVCAPAAVGETWAVGTTITAGSEQLVIDDVHFVDTQGVDLEDVSLLPLTTTDGGVGVSEYPPLDVPGWDRSEPAVGASLAPGEMADLVLPATRTSTAPGTASSVRVDYSAGDESTSRTHELNFVLSDPCD